MLKLLNQLITLTWNRHFRLNQHDGYEKRNNSEEEWVECLKPYLNYFIIAKMTWRNSSFNAFR